MSADVEVLPLDESCPGKPPVEGRDARVRVVSGRQLWAMKRGAQARDRDLAKRGDVPPEAFLLLRPERLLGARIEWPEAPLIDD